MSFAADHGAWMWLAGVLLAGALFPPARFARGRSWRWRAAGILLPLTSAVLMALALAGISVSGEKRAVILLDLSSSTRGSAWRDPAWVRALAEKRLGPQQLISVVGGDGTRHEVLLENATPGEAARWPAHWTWEDHSHSVATNDPSGALTWRSADEMADGGRAHAARWIITDGLFPPPENADPHIAWTVQRPTAIDVGVTDLLLRSSSPGDPSQVEVLAHVRAAGWPARGKTLPETITAVFEVSRDKTRIAAQSVAFHADATLDAARWITVRDTLPIAEATLPHTYEVTIHLAGPGEMQDPWPENDTASAIFAPPGELRTLVIGNREPTFPHTAFVRVNAFVEDAEQLAAEGWQTIILDDVPAVSPVPENPTAPVALAPSTALELSRAVSNNGTGLLILGNGHAFGPGHYGESAGTSTMLDSLAPFWSHPQEGENTHVVFLLDASASMNEVSAEPVGHGTPERKITIAASAIFDACRLLGPDDHITLITFNHSAQVVLDGRADAVRQNYQRQLTAVQPAGETVPDAALPAIIASFTPPIPTVPVSPAHNLLILLTDGDIPSMDVARWRSALAEAKAPLVIVAPPAAATVPVSVLRQLVAVPGTSWSQTPDPTGWTDALVQAIAEQVRGTLHERPIHWTVVDDAALVADAPAWTRVWQKPEALLIAKGSAGDVIEAPLAAVAPRGLGMVGAVAIGNDGSVAYRTLLDRVVRRIAASPGDRRFAISATHTADGDCRITADGIGETGFLNGLSLAVQRVAAGGMAPPGLEPMRQTAPGHYEMRAKGWGAVSLSVVQITTGGAGPSPNALIGRQSLPALETAEWPATVESPFDPAAEGATILPADLADNTRWNIPVAADFSLTPAFWLLAAISVLAALGLRR